MADEELDAAEKKRLEDIKRLFVPEEDHDTPEFKKSIFPWVYMGKIPFHYPFGTTMSAPILMKDDEFVVALLKIPAEYRPKDENVDACGIWGYNFINKSWNYITKFDETIIVNSEVKFSPPTLLKIPNTSSLYFYFVTTGFRQYIFSSINLSNSEQRLIDPGYNWYDRLSKKQKNKKRNKKLQDKMIYKVRTWGPRPVMLCYNNRVHFVQRLEDEKDTKHFSWDCVNTHKIQYHHTFEGKAYFEGYTFLHLKTKNQFLLIGGWENDNIFDHVYFCNLKENKDDKKEEEEDTFEWYQEKSLQKYKIDMSYYKCMLTSNEKKLIIMGGKARNIYILDLDTLILTQSNIVGPDSGRVLYIDESLSSRYGLNNGNNMNLFINGYLRQLGIKLYMPVDMISTIKKMYAKETIHLLRYNASTFKPESGHYMISLDDILNDTVPVKVEDD